MIKRTLQEIADFFGCWLTYDGAIDRRLCLWDKKPRYHESRDACGEFEGYWCCDDEDYKFLILGTECDDELGNDDVDKFYSDKLSDTPILIEPHTTEEIE